MKRLFAFLSALLLAVLYTVPAFAEETPSNSVPDTVAEAYIVIDADTGQVLVEKNMHQRMFPASITKILTVALGLEHGSFDDLVTVDEAAVSSMGSHVALRPGEQLTLRDLSYAAMLPSANDAASAIGIYTAGSIPAFAAMMNEKARSLGCRDTNFTNANGLPDDNHVTSAYDMALITRYALSVPGFSEVWGGEEYLVPPTNKNNSPRQWGTDHMMLVQSAFYYPGTLGGKLGYTEDARCTIATEVERGGMRLICIVLKSGQYDRYRDSIKLLDYCFDNFRRVTVNGTDIEPRLVTRAVEGGSAEEYSVYSDASFSLLLHNSVPASDLVTQVQVPDAYAADEELKPTVRFTLRADTSATYTELGEYPLQYALTSESVSTADPFEKEPIFRSMGVWGKLLLAFGTIFGIVLFLFLTMVVIRYINKYRSWKRRQARIARLQRFNDPALTMRPPPGSVPRTARAIPSRRRRV